MKTSVILRPCIDAISQTVEIGAHATNAIIRRFIRCTLIAAVVLTLSPLYGAAAAAPVRAAGVPAITPLHAARHAGPSALAATPRHDAAAPLAAAATAAAKARRPRPILRRAITLRAHTGAAHPFTASFVRRLKAVSRRMTPRLDPRHAVDFGRIVAVSNGQIVVQQEPLFRVAHPFRHSRSLYSSQGLAPHLERVTIAPRTLVSTTRTDGRVTRRYGATAGLRRRDIVVALGRLTGRDLQATVVAQLSPRHIQALTRAALARGHMRVQHIQLQQSHVAHPSPRAARPHPLALAARLSPLAARLPLLAARLPLLAGQMRPLSDPTTQSQPGTFEGCIPKPACVVNQYTNIQETFTSNQNGLTVYDDGTTKIYLQSIGFTINVADDTFNWPMMFQASAPAAMDQQQQSAIELSVQPQQIALGNYTFNAGIGVSAAANFNVTVFGQSSQLTASAGEGIVDTTAQPAPLAGSSLDISGAGNCMSLVGLDLKAASIASASVCVDIHFDGTNVGVRDMPSGANLVDYVGNPIASPAQGSLSSTPEPLWVIPTQPNWSLQLDHFYWAPRMSVSGYLQIAASPGAGPVGVQCSCLSWNSPAINFPGYPQSIPMVDTIPGDPSAQQQLVHLGGVDGPQTSAVTFSYTSAPAPTVLTYTGGANFETGNDLGVSAKLVDNQGNPVVGGRVTFSLTDQPGRSCTSSALADGSVPQCQINIGLLPPGQYPLYVSYAGGNGYAPSSATPTLSLSATNLTMSYVGHTSDPGQGNGFFVVDIQGLNSPINSQTPGIATLAITFSINGHALCSPDYTNPNESSWPTPGVLQLQCEGFLGVVNAAGHLSGFDAGAYTLNATLAPNSYFQIDPVSAPFTITRLPTSLTATGGGTAAYGGPLTLSSTLSSPDGSPIDQPTLYTLGSGARSQNCATSTYYPGATSDESRSSCTLNMVSLPPGTYPLTISFPGDGVWQPSSTSTTVTVTKGTSTLSYTGPSSVTYHQQSVVLSATLTQPNSGVNLVGQPVHFALGSQSCDAPTDSHGQAACAIGQITQDPGAALTVSYAGSDLYQGTAITPTLGITPAAVALNYTGPTAAVYHDTLTMSGTLSEANGGPAIANQPITFTLGSGGDAQNCAGTTDQQGNASCTLSAIGVTPGAMTVAATYAGDADYQAGAASAAFTLSKEDVHLAYSGPGTSDLHDTVALSGTLTERSDGSGPAIANQPVTLSLGSQSCAGTTDTQGHASCALTPGQTPGAATAAASFSGNADYNAATATAPFTVRKEETAISETVSLPPVAVGQSVTLAATLTDAADHTEGESTAAPIAGESVTLTLGSQSCSGTTGADGTANCTINAVNQPTGYQSVSASFAGDASYLPSTANARQALVYAGLSSGAFTLGDQTAASAVTSGATVTFWGAQWSSLNNLSGGSAPHAFKGFAASLSSTPPVCGGNWTAGPGDSADPPSNVPTYMAVVVPSTVTKSGHTIAGDIAHIVIVKTNRGYGPDPGQPGTGSVVATVCG